MSADEDLSESSAQVSSAVQAAEQTEGNAEFVRDYLQSRAQLVVTNASLVTNEVSLSLCVWCAYIILSDPLKFVDNVVDILDGLQEWPEEVIQSENTGAE